MNEREIRAFGEALREAMDSQGLSADAVAKRAGVTSHTVLSMMEGRRRPQAAKLAAVVQAMNIDLGEIRRWHGGTVLPVVLDEGAFMPVRAHADDAGLDVRSPVEVYVPPLEAAGGVTIDTGLHVAIPVGYVGLLKSKSGLNVLHGITSEGVIDAGYTGSVRVKLYNHSDAGYTVRRGDKISQLVIVPCITPEPVLFEEFGVTDRGDKGFGSSGR